MAIKTFWVANYSNGLTSITVTYDDVLLELAQITYQNLSAKNYIVTGFHNGILLKTYNLVANTPSTSINLAPDHIKVNAVSGGTELPSGWSIGFNPA